MPYITPYERSDVHYGTADNVGQLTFKLTDSITDYIDNKGESFQTYAEILGALEAAKLELYRRRVAPYENQKCLDNGDVY